MTTNSPAAIAGIGRTAFTRRSGRTTLALAVEACRAAIVDAGLTPDAIDGMICYHTGDSATPLDVSWAMGIEQLEVASAVTAGGNAVAEVVRSAAAMVETGICRAVLVYRSMNGRSGPRYGTVTGPVEVPGEWQFSAPHGFMVPPQWIAMWASHHMATYGSTCEDLGHIAITQRTHAVANEHAICRDPLSMDQYLDGRWVNEPFRVFDCAYEVDGAVAVLVVDPELARDTAKQPVWILGSANSQSGQGWVQWEDPSTMYSARVAPKLWDRTGLRPADIDVALMYDCFTYTVMATMEDYGFCEKGVVGEYFATGRASYGGDVVVNPHGGLLSEGYLHGLNHHYEAVLQLRHEAGARQVPDASLALVTAGAGPYGGANVLGVEHG